MLANNYNNWSTQETSKEHRKQAIKAAKEHNRIEKGKTFIRVPHPDLKNTWILKEVK